MGRSPLTPELALRYLDELSTDVRAAVLIDGEGAVAAHSGAGGERADEMCRLARDLFEAADAEAADTGGEPAAEVEVSTARGSVFAVRARAWAIAVVTGRFALSSLMLYDLRAVLAALESEPAPA
jgi:predicted regulator of Ras-like GTPase activity (Roadblock/LC7/MglB family)